MERATEAPTNLTDRDVRQVYQSITCLYPGIDKFSYIATQLMSPKSDLAIALYNLQSAPNETKDMGDRQRNLHYEHLCGSLSLSVQEGTDRFALKRIFYDGVFVDLVAYLGQEDYVHLSAFVHSNRFDIRIARDAFGQPKNQDGYITKFLETVQNKKEEILQAASELGGGDSKKIKQLESILDSIKQTT